MIHVFIISVPSAAERRSHVYNVKTRLESHGCIVEIIDGLYYKQVDIIGLLYGAGMIYDVPDKSVSLSQIGCFLSHRCVWQKIADMSVGDHYLVLEDDMDVCDDFSAEELLGVIPQDYDCAFVWKHPYLEHKQAAELINPHISRFYGGWGTCAYLLQPTAAAYCLKELRSVFAPVDIMLNRNVWPNLRTYVTVKDYFINKGYIGDGDKGDYLFKSLVWG